MGEELSRTEIIAMTIRHHAAQKNLLADNIRGWDRREWTDGAWNCAVPGLTEREKQMWLDVARMVESVL